MPVVLGEGENSTGFVLSLLDAKGKVVFVLDVNAGTTVEKMLPKSVQVKSVKVVAKEE